VLLHSSDNLNSRVTNQISENYLGKAEENNEIQTSVALGKKVKGFLKNDLMMAYVGQKRL
jgi:hypothetical protein